MTVQLNNELLRCLLLLALCVYYNEAGFYFAVFLLACSVVDIASNYYLMRRALRAFFNKKHT